jgi:hypothetical protein
MAKNGNIHPTRIFRSPDELELAWQAYKDHLIEEAHKWPKVQYVGKDGERVEDYPRLPLTQQGFEVFCYKNYGCVEQYFKNPNGVYDEFIPVCSHIKKEREENQITGGLLNIYNASITQRLNNLVEKVEDVTPQKPKKIIVKVNRREDS